MIRCAAAAAAKEQERKSRRRRKRKSGRKQGYAAMIYDVNSDMYRRFLVKVPAKQQVWVKKAKFVS